MKKLFDYIDGLYDAADKRFRREKYWMGIVIHHTGYGSSAPVWKKFFKNISAWMAKKDDVYASAHFHIAREGVNEDDHFALVDQLVDPTLHESFHAGKSQWYHPLLKRIVPDWNRWSIGIELNGDGNRTPYTKAQINSTVRLIVDLYFRFPTIDLDKCLVGHSDIAPGRKTDPGFYFPWDEVRSRVKKEIQDRLAR